MTPDQTAILAVMLDLLQKAYHKQDSALAALQVLPDWREKLATAENDPARINKTESKLAPIHRLSDGIRLEIQDDELWLQWLSEVQQSSILDSDE